MNNKAVDRTIYSLMKGDLSKVDQNSEEIEKVIALKLQKHLS